MEKHLILIKYLFNIFNIQYSIISHINIILGGKIIEHFIPCIVKETEMSTLITSVQNDTAGPRQCNKEK